MRRPNTAVLGRRIEQRMTARITITEPGPPGQWNDETGEYDPSTPIVFYEGKAYVRPTRHAVQDGEQVGQVTAVSTLDVIVPASVGVPDKDKHTLTVTSSGDPALTGQALPVLSSVIDDWHAVRTIVCQWAA